MPWKTDRYECRCAVVDAVRSEHADIDAISHPISHAINWTCIMPIDLDPGFLARVLKRFDTHLFRIAAQKHPCKRQRTAVGVVRFVSRNDKLAAVCVGSPSWGKCRRLVEKALGQS